MWVSLFHLLEVAAAVLQLRTRRAESLVVDWWRKCSETSGDVIHQLALTYVVDKLVAKLNQA